MPPPQRPAAGRSSSRRRRAQANISRSSAGADGLELRVGAVARILVGPPPAEPRVVAEPAVHQPLELDLADPLDPQRLPRHVLAWRSSGSDRPASVRRGAASGCIAAAQSFHGWSASAPARRRLDLARELGAQLGGHGARDADVVQRAVVVVQAEQERPDAVAVLVHPEARDHAVARALVLHLQHRALARADSRRRAACATTPSKPAPSKRENQSAATSRSRVVGSEVDRRARPSRAPVRAWRAVRRTERRAASRRRARGGRTRHTTRGSPPRASAHATRPGAGAAATRRSRDRARSRRRARRRARSDRAAARAAARAARGSSAATASGCATGDRGRRRRGTRCTGTRPTSARRSPRPPAASRASSLASIGSNGGRTGRVTPRRYRVRWERVRRGGRRWRVPFRTTRSPGRRRRRTRARRADVVLRRAPVGSLPGLRP